MSTYHLHARRFEGPLSDPTRNELQTTESDSFTDVMDAGLALVEGGFTVPIFEHGPKRLSDREGPYRLVKEMKPGMP